MWIVVAILLCTLVSSIEGKEKKLGEVVKKDLKYIGCEVCKKAVSELVDLIDRERNITQRKRNVEEIRIIEILDSLCDSTKDGGEWLKRLDIIESTEGKNRYLLLEEPGGIAKCGNECATIAKSCDNLFDEELDRDEITSILWKNKMPKNDLVNKICNKLSSRCKKPVALPSDYARKDIPFEPQTEKEIEMEKLLESMKASGIGGSMYGRDDLEEMMQMYGGDLDEGSDGAFDGIDSEAAVNDDSDFDSLESSNTIAGSNVEF